VNWLRRWWRRQCGVVRSGVDSTWSRSHVDVHCAWWVPRSLAVERARESIMVSYPNYWQRAILVSSERWVLRAKCPNVRSYRGYRVTFDKTGIYWAIYGRKPDGMS
jgi:hypothetical protein